MGKDWSVIMYSTGDASHLKKMPAQDQVPLHKSVVLNGMTLQQNAVMVSFVKVNIASTQAIKTILQFVQWMVKNRLDVDRKRVKILVAGLVCHEQQYWRCVKEENKNCSGP